MRSTLNIAHAGLLVGALWMPAIAIADVPPHTPGTICATQQGWCRAIYPGPPGTRCTCGSVPGVLV